MPENNARRKCWDWFCVPMTGTDTTKIYILRKVQCTQLSAIVILFVATVVFFSLFISSRRYLGHEMKSNADAIREMQTFDHYISQNEMDTFLKSLMSHMVVSVDGMTRNEEAIIQNMREPLMSLAYQPKCYADSNLIEIDGSTDHIIPDKCIAEYMILCGNNASSPSYRNTCEQILADTSFRIVPTYKTVIAVSGVEAACWAGLCMQRSPGEPDTESAVPNTNMSLPEYKPMCDSVRNYDSMPEAVHGVKCAALHHIDNLKPIIT